MIKHINHQNFSTTPFVAAKSWDLYNVQNEDTILLEPSGTLDDTFVALDYIDYDTGIPLLNRACNIAPEQQTSDILYYQEGITGSGMFDPNTDPKNYDGTYKSLVHSQVSNAFYNKRNNPTQIFGVEYVDFSLSNTKRFVSDYFRMFTIPRNIFGEKITPNSVYFYDTSLDDNVIVHDDGYQNLNAGFDLFSKVQEIRTYVPPTGSNNIQPGPASYSCLTYDNMPVTASVTESAYLSIGFYNGLAKTIPVGEPDTSSFIEMAFLSGSVFDTASADFWSLHPTFLYGYVDNYVSHEYAGITSVGFLSGSVFYPLVTGSIMPEETASIAIGFLSGTMKDIMVPIIGSNDTASIANITFMSGTMMNVSVTMSGAGGVPDSSSYAMTFMSGTFRIISLPTPLLWYDTASLTVGFSSGYVV